MEVSQEKQTCFSKLVLDNTYKNCIYWSITRTHWKAHIHSEQESVMEGILKLISSLLVLFHQLKNLPKPLILQTNQKHKPLFPLYIKPSLYFFFRFNLLLHVPGYFFIWVVSLVIGCARQLGSLSWTPLLPIPGKSSFPGPFQWDIGPKWAH